MVKKRSASAKNKRKNGQKKLKTGPSKKSLSERVREEVGVETLRASLSILFLSFAIVLFMAAFGMAGRFGNAFYGSLGSFLGFGYYLLPLSFLIISGTLYFNRKKRLGLLKALSLLFFFISALALMELAKEGLGGSLGGLVLYPVVYAFDKAAGALILVSLSLASLFLIFDSNPGDILSLVLKKDKEESILDEKEESVIQSGLEKVEVSKSENSDKKKTERDNDADGKVGRSIMNNIKKATDKAKEIVEMDNEKNFFDTDYKVPPLKLLRKDSGKPSVGDIKANANIIKRTLANFNIQVEMDEITIGPTVTRYAMKPAEGVRLSKILSLHSNLELALAASPVRIEAPIPGKSLVGIEVPNSAKTTLGLGSMLASVQFKAGDKILPIALGKDITGAAHFTDLAKAPHMIIAGATGAGKSVTIHDIIISLLYKYGPDMLRFIMVDPKRVELTLYNGIAHLLTPVIVNPKKAILTLKWVISEMERRYDVLEGHKLQNLHTYHEKILKKAKEKNLPEEEMPEALPYIVLIIDELADIMQSYPKELESAIVRIAQKSRAVGIHLILATQRPDVRTITGLIKANVPTRIALKVPSQIDSRTILDQAGAEKLLGAGDMLFLSGSMAKPHRIQAPFISNEEIKATVRYIIKNFSGDLSDEIDLESVGKDSLAFSSGNLLNDDDERNSDEYKQARDLVISAQTASTSFLQRKLRIGYNKASRFMDMLEEDGIVGPANGAKAREVLVSQDQGEALDDSGNEILADQQSDDTEEVQDNASDERNYENSV